VSASAIERLRSSLARAERPKADVITAAEEVPLSPNGGTGNNGGHGQPTPEPVSETDPVETGTAATAEAAKAPQLDFLFRSKNARQNPADSSFDALWPKRPARGSDSGVKTAAKPASGAAAATEPPRAPSGILKSGVVDGMAYTLYADGSIEAQLPQGTVRFGSIAELRAHIENNQ
jgi:hypothetical protein